MTKIIVKRRKQAAKYSNVFSYMESRGFKLFPYQQTGVTWMLDRELGNSSIKGALLCDEPGLGKTIQTCAMMYGNPKSKTLLIVPGAVVHQWKDAFERILPECNIYLHHGSNRARTVSEMMMKNFNIAITTLGMVYGRKSSFRTVLHLMKWDRIVIDEIHYIRNKSSKTAVACQELKATHKWGLTGTPIQNSESDLISLYKYIGVPSITKSKLPVINKHLLLRRTKEMVVKYNNQLKLPSLFQEIHALEFMNDRERTLYRKIKENAKEEYLEIVGNETMSNNEKMVELFELLLRLRQATIHPQLVINGFQRKFDTKFKSYGQISTKMYQIIQMIKQLDALKNVLVFCHYSEEIELMQNYLNEAGIMNEKYTGSMSMTERKAVLDKFPYKKEIRKIMEQKQIHVESIVKNVANNFPRVLLIQINAGGVGLNLQQFTEVFITSPDWNPSNEIQAIARAHRLGQTQSVTVHRFSLHDQNEEFSTIDERIINIQTKKRQLMADYLNDESLKNTGKLNTSLISNKNFLHKLTENDFHQLFM